MLLFRRAAEITAEGKVQVGALAQAGGTDFGEFDLRGQVFSGEPQDGEHVRLALVEPLEPCTEAARRIARFIAGSTALQPAA